MRAFLILASLIPYVWVGAGIDSFAPTSQTRVLVVTGMTCTVFHALFIWSCLRFGYAMLTLTHFFLWIFMGFAPLMCALSGRWLWGDINVEKAGTIIEASAMSMVFAVLVQVAHTWAFNRSNFMRCTPFRGETTMVRWCAASLIALACSATVIGLLGFGGLLYRTGGESFVSTGPVASFVQNVLRPVPLFVGVPLVWMAFSRNSGRGAQISGVIAVGVLCFAIIVNLPVSVARYYALMVIGVMFYYSLLTFKVMRSSWVTGLFLITGFMASFAIDPLRYVTSGDQLRATVSEVKQTSAEKFFAGHVDAFEMLVYGVDYVEEIGSTNGRQLAGVILFWVPRSVWPDKPRDTGRLLGGAFINIMGATSNINLSSPIVLEAYINGGMLGVAVAGVLIGIGLGKFDRAIVERMRAIGRGEYLPWRLDAVAAPLLGLWIYLLRGSLLSSFAYSVGIICASVITWHIICERR